MRTFWTFLLVLALLLVVASVVRPIRTKLDIEEKHSLNPEFSRKAGVHCIVTEGHEYNIEYWETDKALEITHRRTNEKMWKNATNMEMSAMYPNDYPEECNHYLPLLTGIGMQTKFLLDHWGKYKLKNTNTEKRDTESYLAVMITNHSVEKIKDARNDLWADEVNPVMRELIKIALKKYAIPDGRYIVATSKYMDTLLEVHFTFSKKGNEPLFMIPHNVMKRHGHKIQFQDKIDRALVVGNIKSEKAREALIFMAELYPEYIDTSQMIHYQPMDPCSFKYIIVIVEDNSPDIPVSNLERYLQCGSVVLAYKNPAYSEFFYPLLPVDANYFQWIEEDNFHDVIQKMDALKNLPQDVLGDNAFKFSELVTQQLSNEGIQCYIASAFKRLNDLVAQADALHPVLPLRRDTKGNIKLWNWKKE
jgi:hypothetical protein